MSASNGQRIFLCHSSADKPIVRELCARLQKDGFRPWLDEQDINPGDEWEMAIHSALRTSDVIVVCLSHTSVTRAGYLHKEIKFALDRADEQPERRRVLIPVRLDECPIPERLSRFQWLNLFEATGYERLKNALRTSMADPPRDGRAFKRYGRSQTSRPFVRHSWLDRGRPWMIRSIGVLMITALAAYGLYHSQWRERASRILRSGHDLQSTRRTLNGLNKSDLEFCVRHVYVWGQAIAVEIGAFEPSHIQGLRSVTIRASMKDASQNVVWHLSSDGTQIMADGLSFDIRQNPFAANTRKISVAHAPSFGRKGAPVVIVAYADFQCEHCSKLLLTLRAKLPATYPESVRVYFRDFPIPQLHAWAMEAAVAGRCIYRLYPDQFWRFHDWLFTNQKTISAQNLHDRIHGLLKGPRADPAGVARCIRYRENDADIKETLAEVASLQLDSAPTLFVNGRKLVGAIEWSSLKQIIDYEIEYQAVMHNAGDREVM